MSDDWRLRIDVRDSAAGAELARGLEQAEHDLEHDFGDRVAISEDGSELFCYTGTRALAERVGALAGQLAAEHGWQVDTELKRWHPAAEEWEDPDVPLATQADHDELIARERAETAAHGWPEFEVRVVLPSRHAAVEFADKLRAKGLPYVRRWRYVLVGATDEDAAAQLADRFRAEAPAGSSARVEGTWRAVEAEEPSRYRTLAAYFGGLGG